MGKQFTEWRNAFFQAAIVIFVLFILFWPIRLEGDSMNSSLHEGDIVFVSRIYATMEMYKQGDIIVFYHLQDGEQETMLKRVVALPGDYIEITLEGVFVNNELLTEDYVTGQTYGLVSYVVPADSVFVMGDNREISFDSRHTGAIPYSEIQGKVILHIPLS